MPPVTRKRATETAEQTQQTKPAATSKAKAKAKDVVEDKSPPVVAKDDEKSTLLEYVPIEPRPHYSLPPGDDEDDDEDSEDDEEDGDVDSNEKPKSTSPTTQEDPNKSIPPPPPNGFVISSPALTIFKNHKVAAIKRDQDLFCMHVFNDFTGYGLQEVIENQLNEFNVLMNEKEPDAIKLWVQLSALAQWLMNQQLGPWMMQDDGARWSDTVFMIGVAALTTLNMVERSGLLDLKNARLRIWGSLLRYLANFWLIASI